ncbi:MAG: hypothetical protein KDA60_00270 [Planctomycetales bacterium]|nr:hypothetical protein [Planctomycetales bacterium]
MKTRAFRAKSPQLGLTAREYTRFPKLTPSPYFRARIVELSPITFGAVVYAKLPQDFRHAILLFTPHTGADEFQSWSISASMTGGVPGAALLGCLRETGLARASPNLRPSVL